MEFEPPPSLVSHDLDTGDKSGVGGDFDFKGSFENALNKRLASVRARENNVIDVSANGSKVRVSQHPPDVDAVIGN